MVWRLVPENRRKNITQASDELIKFVTQLVEVALERLEKDGKLNKFGGREVCLEINNGGGGKFFKITDQCVNDWGLPENSKEREDRLSLGLFICQSDSDENGDPIGISDSLQLPRVADLVTRRNLFSIKEVYHVAIIIATKNIKEASVHPCAL